MPEIKEATTKATLLRKGHEFRWRSRWWSIDEEPTVKTRYVYIDVGHQEPFQLPKDADVKIRYSQPTMQETHDELLAFQAELIRRKLDGFKAAWEEALKTYRESPSPDSHDFIQITAAKERFKTWGRIARILQHKEGDTLMPLDEVLSRADDQDLVDAVREQMDEVFREVWRRGGSRSGSLMHQAVLEEQLDWLREWHDEWKFNLAHLLFLQGELARKEASNA